jgi:hypothetical protein
MAFDVGENDVTRGLMKCAYDQVYDVPICLECAVGEAGLVGSRGVDSFQQRVIVATELDFPSGFVLTEVEEVVKKASHR